MTLPRLEQMRTYWEEQPPVHISVAAFMSGKSEETPTVSQGQDFGSLMEAFPQRG
jgi:hypothetical protein